MKKQKSKRLALSMLPILALLIYGIWPLPNTDFTISVDSEKMAYKAAYMQQEALLPSTQKLPNIVVILADDLSRQDVSRYGGEHVQTPHIDAIGANGVTFTEAYAASPICAPSRAGLITGRYPQRFGFEINLHERYPRNRLEYFVFSYLLDTGNWKVAALQNWEVPSVAEMQKQGLPPSEFTLAEYLKPLGYQTAAIGKWHLGFNESAIPNNRGFDYHYGFYEAFSLYAPEDASNIVNQHLTDFSDPHIWKKGRMGTCAIVRNGEPVQEETYLTNRFAAEAKEWITAHQEDPFFIYIPFSAPHTPFQVTKDYYDQFDQVRSPEKRIYYAMIKALDDAVGSIMEHLKALNLEENTLVFFMSDNGGAEYTLAADNSPLKGGKFSNFEGGINVPFMMQWKGVLPEGVECNDPVSSLDIFATVAALTGVGVPTDRTYDGVDLLPYFLTDSLMGKRPHETLYWRSKYHKAIREGDWKLIRDDMSQKTVLYNLKEDKYEQVDQSAAFPEVVAQLSLNIKEWESTLMDPAWPRVMDYEILEGRDTFYFPL
ncbi:MAG: sulfatase-like hydrolase/transferase [Saprospiraceae bacterium]|nr:sulfatase-like hydrolase/transferase [Saprospiraceae bacterium]